MNKKNIIKLNGADYFLLAVDRFMQKSNTNGNICHFLIELDQTLDKERLEEKLNNNLTLKKIYNLSLKKIIFTIPFWKQNNNLKKIKLKEFEANSVNEIISNFLPKKINLKKEPPIQFSIISINNKNSILMTWHHALVDSRGAESLIKSISNNVEIDLNDDTNSKDNESTLRKLKESKDVSNYLYECCKEPLIEISKDTKTSTKENLKYDQIFFTEKETKTIDTRSAQHTSIFKSAFYLAASARAFYKTYKNSSQTRKDGDLLIPVPQDQRKRGDNKIISNHVSFLFYRIPRESLESLELTSKFLLEEMKKIMSSGILKKYINFMLLCRRMPLALYTKLILSPSSGQLASFSFSDTGDSLKDFQSFLDIPVNSALHIPPNVNPPGFTIIFSRFQSRIQLSIARYADTMSDNDFQKYITNLKSDLLGKSE